MKMKHNYHLTLLCASISLFYFSAAAAMNNQQGSKNSFGWDGAKGILSKTFQLIGAHPYIATTGLYIISAIAAPAYCYYTIDLFRILKFRID